MPIPNLLHPVPIVILPLDTASTHYDGEYREPVQVVARGAAVTVNGQVFWDKGMTMSVSPGGVSLKCDGYVLFRHIDLNSFGLNLKVNDRITYIAGVEYDLYVVSLIPMGHYPILGATLVKAFFADRRLTRKGLDVYVD